MRRFRRRPVRLAALVLPAALLAVACGSQEISLPGEQDQAIIHGAELFSQRCSGCHTLKVVGTQGSADNVNDREYKDGPNFNVRKVQRDQILYAIRNGGFSSGPMPQNIAVGKDADDIAKFLAKYSGLDAAETVSPGA